MNFLFECSICSKTLEQPVFLPCCHTVCKKHENNGSGQLTCLTCHVTHSIPENGGFPTNLLVENLIKQKLESELGPEHRAALSTLKDLRKKVDEVKRKVKWSESEIDGYIRDLINRIDLKREEAKVKIDKEALELIKELEDHKESCLANLKTDRSVLLRSTEVSVNNVEKKLASWQNELNTYEDKEQKWKSITEAAYSKYEHFRKLNDRLNEILLSTPKLDIIELRESNFFHFCNPNEPIMYDFYVRFF